MTASAYSLGSLLQREFWNCRTGAPSSAGCTALNATSSVLVHVGLSPSMGQAMKPDITAERAVWTGHSDERHSIKAMYGEGILKLIRFNFLSNATPFDVRCMLSIIVLATAWKLLSLDFSALRDLCAVPPVFSFSPLSFYSTFAGMQCNLFSTIPPGAFQIATAAALIAFVIKPARLILILAITGLWLIDTSGALYRWNMYDFDTPRAILTMIAVLPMSL